MSRPPNYDICKDTPEALTLRDVGPWDRYLTITNGAEDVVEALCARLGKRGLFYYDGDGQLDEIVHEGGRFVGFKAVVPQ